MNSSRTHFAERRRRARNAAPAPAPAATSYFGLDFGIYDLFCCAPQQPDPAAAPATPPGDVETVLEVDVSPRRPAARPSTSWPLQTRRSSWERLAPPTRDDTRRPHEVSMDVDDAPPALPPPPPPPAAGVARAVARSRRAPRGAPSARNRQKPPPGERKHGRNARRGFTPRSQGAAGSRRVREMKNVADLPEQRAVAFPGALPRDADVP